MKNENGISLVSLAVIIIVLLLLAGVTFVIVSQFMGHEIETVSAQMTESILQEKIEMAWLDMKSLYLLKGETVSDMTEKDFFKESLTKRLQEVYQLDNVVVTKEKDSSIDISFIYQNQIYDFSIVADGKIKINHFLKGHVKIGDYLEYPIEYVDIYSGKEYTADNGWRVIDDDVMEGTSGYVKIISTGIPVKWFYDSEDYPNNQEAVDYLLKDFEKITCFNTSMSGVEIENDFGDSFENLTLEDDLIEKSEMKGSDFKVEAIAEKVTTLTLEEVNQVCNFLYQTKREKGDTSKIKDSQHLFDLKDSGNYYYWLATAKEESNNEVYYLSEAEIQAARIYRIGIRPVVYLKKNLEGTFENNVWKIMN